MVIEDCGELAKDEDWKYYDNDETADKLPPFPNDWDLKDDERSVRYVKINLKYSKFVIFYRLALLAHFFFFEK